MKYTEAKQGRVFVVRLEDGEIVHEQIEKFALEQSIGAAALIAVGGASKGSRLVVGPEDGDQRPVNPASLVLDDVYEIAGTGTLFPDEDGKPLLHMHMACGRNTKAVAGCIRNGVKVWQIMEIAIFELVGTEAKRSLNRELGFKLLEP
jgi:predicted DNA-binding protein with PD1-like motif